MVILGLYKNTYLYMEHDTKIVSVIFCEASIFKMVATFYLACHLELEMKLGYCGTGARDYCT